MLIPTKKHFLSVIQWDPKKGKTSFLQVENVFTTDQVVSPPDLNMQQQSIKDPPDINMQQQSIKD